MSTNVQGIPKAVRAEHRGDSSGQDEPLCSWPLRKRTQGFALPHRRNEETAVVTLLNLIKNLSRRNYSFKTMSMDMTAAMMS